MLEENQIDQINIDDLPFESVLDSKVQQFEEDDHVTIPQTQKLQLKKSDQIFNPLQLQVVKTPIDKEGIFYKVSPHLLESNQQYYCTLSRRRFTYYSNKNRDKPLGILDFDWQKYIFTYQLNKEQQIIEFKFQPEGSDKKFIFQVPSKMREEFKDWVTLIQNYIIYSYGFQNTQTSIVKQYRFWRHERILNQDIINYAQTGDLLVFRNKGTLANIQRSITRSDFDHIVMFIREDDGDLLLLESSNQFGVITFSYERFVKNRSFRNFEKILYKQLQCDQSKRVQMRENSYLQVGKGYSLSMMKLFGQSKRQNFFCSELIAYIYQLSDIIDKNEKCCKYLPGNFTDESTTILKNSKLSQDFIIDYYYD
ncbi:hypothetical protein pb186bvf_012839 [Paramecium bursaria]